MLNVFNTFSSLLYPKQKRKQRTCNSHKYKKTVIYEIRAIEYPEIFYIGHTINPITRFAQHKAEAIASKNTHLKSRYMRLIGVDNFTFKILCTFSCANRLEAEIIEARYIKRLKPPMNTEFVTVSQKEINENKYKEFSSKIQFSPLYTFGKELLKMLNIL
jgi:predicted GIY-YIG superfamily endonuclease